MYALNSILFLFLIDNAWMGALNSIFLFLFSFEWQSILKCINILEKYVQIFERECMFKDFFSHIFKGECVYKNIFNDYVCTKVFFFPKHMYTNFNICTQFQRIMYLQISKGECIYNFFFKNFKCVYVWKIFFFMRKCIYECMIIFRKSF